MSQIMTKGRRLATSVTKSHSPNPAIRSTTSVAVRSTPSINEVIMRGVKPADTILRKRACLGSSMLIMDPKNSLNSGGTSGIFTPLPEQKSCGFLLASITSAWRVIAQYPGPGGKYGVTASSKNRTGSSLRKVLKAATRSSMGNAQNSSIPERLICPSFINRP